MPNSNSKLSLEINDQYFTPVDTAEWCFKTIKEEIGWTFEGTALEPSVGAYAFPEASKNLGLKLDWTTNDLFPQEEWEPDFVEDFKTHDFGDFDYVITNPPFGYASSLARFFMKKSLTISPRVLMLLPKGARRLGFQDSMPRNAKKVADIGLEDETFVSSTGEIKQVKTCIQAWETTEEEQPTIKETLDLRTDLFEQWDSKNSDWDHGMDYQVVRWGNKAGSIVPKTRERRSGALRSVHLKNISKEEYVSIQQSLDFSDFDDMSTSAPAFDVPIWIHRFNSEAVKRGLQPPT